MNRIPIALLAALAFTAGCSRPGIKGDGVIKTETRPVTEFAKITVGGRYEIEWSSGKPALSLAADQNLLPLIRITAGGNELRVDSAEKLDPSQPIKLVVSSGALADVHIAGDVRFKANRLSGENFRIEAAGNTAMHIDGAVTNLAASLTGDNKLDAKTLQTQSVDLKMIGSSHAEVTVANALKVSIIGDGTCTYAGNPPTVEKSGIGSANVRPRP